MKRKCAILMLLGVSWGPAACDSDASDSQSPSSRGIRDAYEFNDNSAVAWDLGSGFGNHRIEATVWPSGDEDWYSVSVDAGMELVLNMLEQPRVTNPLSGGWGSTRPYDLSLVDPEGRFVSLAFDAPHRHTATLPGKYRVRVRSGFRADELSGASYTLSVIVQFPSRLPIERVNVTREGVEADADCRESALSGDGRYAAFVAGGSNLVPGSIKDDILLKDRLTVIAEKLAAAGLTSMIVWVLKDNPACAFYETLGGTRVGSKPIVIGGANLEETAFGWLDIQTLLDRTR